MTKLCALVPVIVALLCSTRVHGTTDDTKEVTALAINLEVKFDRDMRLGKYNRVNNCHGPIHYYSRNFSQFITQSHVIVDKSLFIKEMIESPHKAILITVPRHWGKTIALNWVKAFLEIELDPETGLEYEYNAEKENYLIFKRGRIRNVLKLQEPLLINRYPELFDKYHGKWPVIHQRLTFFPAIDYENVQVLLLLAVANAYYRHSYLLQSYQRTANSANSTEEQKEQARELAKKFEVYLTGEMSPGQTLVGLRYLSELLYNHFNRKVYMLIDEYDDLINFLLIESWPDEKDQMMQFYMIFLRNTLCDNPYIEKIIATGVSQLGRSYANDIFGHYASYNYIDNPYWQYFGYHEREIDILNEYLRNSPANQTEVREWYNGYSVGLTRPHKIYNPQLVNFFWETKEHRDYVWEPRSGLIEYLLPQLWNIRHFEEIWAVINSGTGGHTIRTNLLEQPYDRFKRLIDAVATGHYEHHEDGVEVIDVILGYLLELGYFTWTNLEYPITSKITTVTLKTPNKNFFYRMRNGTFEFYAERYFLVSKGLPTETLEDHGLAVEGNLTQLIETDCKDTEGFRKAYAKFFTIIPQLLRIVPIIQIQPETNVTTTPKPYTLSTYPIRATDERLARSSLYCIFGYSKNRQFHVQNSVLHAKTKKPDIILTRGNRAVVINLKYTYENDTSFVLEQNVHDVIDSSYADIFKHSEHFKHIQNVALVAVHVQQGFMASVQVRAWNEAIHR